RGAALVRRECGAGAARGSRRPARRSGGGDGQQAIRYSESHSNGGTPQPHAVWSRLTLIRGRTQHMGSRWGSRWDDRWAILALLFAVRLGMAFQFQSVAAISPVVMREFGVGLADIGLMISLYLAPGLAIALPGGEIGRRCGDKRAVLLGLALMIGGGLTMALAPSWPWQIAGRLLAGIGGVLLNVLMSKMVTDWFAGREIATAMGIFVTSWPVGIAMALIALPPLAEAGGASAVQLCAVASALVGFLATSLLYRAPPDRAAAAASAAAWPAGAALYAVIAAGAIWGLYNAALGMVFGFG